MERGCVATFSAASGAPSLDIPDAPESGLCVNRCHLSGFEPRFIVASRFASPVDPRQINNDEAQAVELESVSLREALDILMQTNGLFYKSVGSSSVMVTPRKNQRN